MENEFYDKLPNYFKDFFNRYNYKPANVFDANNFLKSCLKLNELTDIYVQPKKPIIFKGKIMKFVKITSEQPFMACVPQVWEAMNLQQRLKTVTMVFNYYFGEMIKDRKKKPEIHFIPEFDFPSSVLGLSYFPKKYIYIPLEKILSSKSSIKIFSTIVHELVHFRQLDEKKQICEWLSKNDYDFSKLSSYQKHLFFKCTGSILSSIFNYNKNKSLELFEQMMNSSNLTRENINLWLELEEKKDKQWQLLKELTYSLSDIEKTAQIEETNVYNKLLLEYGNKKDKAYQEKPLSEYGLNEIKKSGFDINDDSAKRLAEIGYFTNMINITDEVCFDILNYLLEIYKAKKIIYPFVENYDDIEKKYFDSQREMLLKQKENSKECEKVGGKAEYEF